MTQTPSMTGLVAEVPVTDVPMALLLLADPSEEKVRAYLLGSRGFVVTGEDGQVVGACVVQPLGAGRFELMNIAVVPACQGAGYGTALLQQVIETLRREGAAELAVGTGTFGYQLAFYQRQGFRVTGIDRNFFLDNYPQAVIEDGIRHLDMLRLTLRMSEGAP